MSEYRAENGARLVRLRMPRPILVYLGILLAVVALPILVFSTALIVRQNQAQSEVVETLSFATTRAALQSVEREVAGMITTMRVLMTLTSFTEGDYEEFHIRARMALRGTGTQLAIVDRNAQTLLDTSVEFGEALPTITDPGTIERSFSTPDTQITPALFRESAQEWVFNAVRRFPDSDNPAGAVVLIAQADSLRSILSGRELPSGWQMALVDRNNRVLTSSGGVVETGTTLFLPLTSDRASTSRWYNQTAEGVEYKTITQRSLLTGWYVVAWAPSAVVEAPLRTSFLFLVAGGLLILLLAGGAAFIVARQIASSVRGLARDARRLGAGEAISAKIYPVEELTEVSEALAEAAQLRLAAESEARFLMRELAHRSKNQLSVIGAMAKQTAQGSETVGQFVESFQHRILGLARSTDLLVAHGSGGITLGDLVATQLEPFRPEDEARVTIEGPRIRLNVQAAQVLGMAMHELATNAAKYGAFSSPEGRAEVTWATEGENLELSWREHVPDFTPPSDRSGFGTVVLKRMVAGSLAATVEREVHADGIGWTFSIPLDQIDPDRASAPHNGQQ